MLSKVLNKSTCAKCKICCGFEKSDEWETPCITKEQADELQKKGIKIRKNGENYTYDLEFSGDEVKYCPYLDFKKGCTLSNDEKPFDCKIWPVRLMQKDGEFYIAVANICPEFKGNVENLKDLVDNELIYTIKDYLKNNKYFINGLRDDYTVIEKINPEE